MDNPERERVVVRVKTFTLPQHFFFLFLIGQLGANLGQLRFHSKTFLSRIPEEANNQFGRTGIGQGIILDLSSTFLEYSGTSSCRGCGGGGFGSMANVMPSLFLKQDPVVPPPTCASVAYTCAQGWKPKGVPMSEVANNGRERREPNIEGHERQQKVS